MRLQSLWRPRLREHLPKPPVPVAFFTSQACRRAAFAASRSHDQPGDDHKRPARDLSLMRKLIHLFDRANDILSVFR